MMSGTSVDGIDVVVADLVESTSLLPPNHQPDGQQRPQQSTPALSMQQLAFATVPWAETHRRQLFALFHEATSAAALCRANFFVAEVFADTAHHLLKEAGIEPASVDLIASHGQTIWHDVVAGKVTSTLQIGDPSVIATRTGITTIGNFRTADVAAGGQGAPLVSLYDWYFLRPTAPTANARDESNGLIGEQWRAVQNIGGIGNVTFLPPDGSKQPPLAFDTGPGNVFIDWAAERATNGQQQFDRDGVLAAAGIPSAALLSRCLMLPYFAQMPPKSTGRELFDNQLAAEWWTLAQAEGLSAADFVATMTELTAITIADAYRRFATGTITEVIVAGGGARNPILLQRLGRQLAEKLGRIVPVRTHADLGIDDKAKEALAFALMGYLALHGTAGNVPACTGAATPQILGQIAPGSNFRSLLARLR
jgi:anhydro-N-acetylmuramic acid kinase